VLSEPDPTSGMTGPTGPSKGSDEEAKTLVGEASQLIMPLPGSVRFVAAVGVHGSVRELTRPQPQD
jgi:hypothetical protein